MTDPLFYIHQKEKTTPKIAAKNNVGLFKRAFRKSLCNIMQ